MSSWSGKAISDPAPASHVDCQLVGLTRQLATRALLPPDLLVCFRPIWLLPLDVDGFLLSVGVELVDVLGSEALRRNVAQDERLVDGPPRQLVHDDIPNELQRKRKQGQEVSTWRLR